MDKSSLINTNKVYTFNEIDTNLTSSNNDIHNSSNYSLSINDSNWSCITSNFSYISNNTIINNEITNNNSNEIISKIYRNINLDDKSFKDNLA